MGSATWPERSSGDTAADIRLLSAALVVAASNITLDDVQAIDGVTVAAGDRVLAVGQTAAAENGLWTVVAGDAWTRPGDYDADADLVQGQIVPVLSGTVYAGTIWELTTADPTIAGSKAFVHTSASTNVVEWFRNVSAFIQSQQSTLQVATLATECTQTGAELDVSAATGTGTCIPVTTLAGGVIRSASGATANSFRYLKNRGGATSPVVSNTRTAKYAVATRVRIVATAATFAIDLCGFTDEATFATAIEALQTVSAVNYVLHVGSHAGQNTGVAFSVGTWVTLIMIADGTNIRAYLASAGGTGPTIIGVAQAQVTAPTAAGAFLINAQNLVTAANVSVDCDAALVLTERAS